MAKTNQCPECGEEIQDLRVTCPNCGYEYSDKDYTNPDAGNEFLAGAAIDESGEEITDSEAAGADVDGPADSEGGRPE